jgi:hypothetical protein
LSTSDPNLITATLQELVDMDDHEWQSYRYGSLSLAKNYVNQLNVDKEYGILFKIDLISTP